MFNSEVFAGNLRALRARKRITQQELADGIDVSLASIANYENAVFVPSIEVACKLADFYEVPLAQLVGRDESQVISYL